MNSVKSKLTSSKEKNNLDKIIYEAQEEKVKIFVSAGMLLHEKIRKNEIEDYELINKFEGMLELDKIIYDSNIKISELENEDSIKCECGSDLNIKNKFCAECGKKVEDELEINKQCKYCNSKVNYDFNFCICCGNKLD